MFVVVGLLTGFAILQARAPRVSVQRGAERADKRDRSTWNYHYTMRAGELRKKKRTQTAQGRDGTWSTWSINK